MLPHFHCCFLRLATPESTEAHLARCCYGDWRCCCQVPFAALVRKNRLLQRGDLLCKCCRSSLSKAVKVSHVSLLQLWSLRLLRLGQGMQTKATSHLKATLLVCDASRYSEVFGAGLAAVQYRV